MPTEVFGSPVYTKMKMRVLQPDLFPIHVGVQSFRCQPLLSKFGNGGLTATRFCLLADKGGHRMVAYIDEMKFDKMYCVLRVCKSALKYYLIICIVHQYCRNKYCATFGRLKCLFTSQYAWTPINRVNSHNLQKAQKSRVGFTEEIKY